MNVNRQIVSNDEELEHDSDEEMLSDDSEHAPISSKKKNDNSETDTGSEENENKIDINTFAQPDDDAQVQKITSEVKEVEPRVRMCS